MTQRGRGIAAGPMRRLIAHPLFKAAMVVLSVLCAAPSDCGGGGGLSANNYSVPNQIGTANLTAAQVNQIAAQAAAEATARSAPATIAIVDRVGNVLGVYQMAGAPASATITSNRGVTTGLENISVPSTVAAISKAITAAYLSSGGNAFSTRTANEIIQEHFPPTINGNPSGPLFGVQFSQLVCADFGEAAQTPPGIGPHHAPLGLAADPGGLPIYINGVLVGGIGVMSGTTYSVNDSLNLPDNNDEGIALAGESGFGAPEQIQAQNVAVNGINLDYLGQSSTHGAAAGAPPPLVAVAGFFGGTAQAGLAYGTTTSGVAPDTTATGGPFYPGTDFLDFVDATGANRYPPTVGTVPTDGNEITAAEAQALVVNALDVAEQARAGIRVPSNTHAQVTVSVVDLDGNILAMARTPDAPVFSADVSLQKARSSVYFSRDDADSAYAEISALGGTSSTAGLGGAYTGAFSDYVKAVNVGDPTLFDQGTAFSEVSIGALARPFLPDGNDAQGNGPLSLPFTQWSPFSTGLQVDLIKPDLAALLGGTTSFPHGCGSLVGLPNNSKGFTRIANGLQIFSGGYPIYRNDELVGAIGVSGDGIQQDALVAFLGIQGDGAIGVTGVPTLQNAPTSIRADQPSRVSVTENPPGATPFTPQYITCPAAPFLTSSQQTPC